MSGYTYGQRRGAASQFSGGGSCQAGYPATASNVNAHVAAAGASPSSGPQSFGAMAYPHIPSINESSDFSNSYGSDPYNCYQRQPQNHVQRMNSNITDGNRGYSAVGMEANAYNRHSMSAGGMQSSYPAMAPPTGNRRPAAPPNVGVNAFSTMTRSQSFSGHTDSQYSNRNNALSQHAYQTNPAMPMKSQHFGDAHGSYGHNQSQTSMTYNRSAAMKSSEVWDRTHQPRVGPNSYSSSHSVNSNVSNKMGSNQHLQSPMSYPASQPNTPNVYGAVGQSGMHHSGPAMDMSVNSDASSDFGMKGNQCVNPATGPVMGQSYGNNQAMYPGSSMGAASTCTNTGVRVPNQPPVVGSAYNSYSNGSYTQGSMQRLRHFGPMPNSNSGYVRQSARQNHGSSMTMRGMGAGTSSSQTVHGGWQSNDPSQRTYPTQNSQKSSQMTPNVPFNGLPQQSNMPAQVVNYNNNFPGVSHQQQQMSRNLPGPVLSNNTAANTNTAFSQNDSTTPPQFTATPCQEKGDNAITPFPTTDTEAMLQQLNQDRIFSAELEKLARLSRNPMSDDFISDTSSCAQTSSIGDDVLNSACAGTNTYQSQGNVDELIENGNRSTTNIEQSTVTPNASVQITGTTPSLKSPCTTVGGSFQPSKSGISQQEQASSSSAPQTPNSTVSGNSNNIAKTKTQVSVNPKFDGEHSESSDKCPKEKCGDGCSKSDAQNSVQELQRMTQSIKDTSKQDDLMKVASSQHAEYLSHSSSDGYGSQNCIAALSAACRNIIADMDSSMPKPNGTQKVHSPLGSKSGKYDGGSGYAGKAEPLSGFGSGPPSVASTGIGDQFATPSSCMMTPNPSCVPMDSFPAFPANFNGANPMPVQDFQGKFHDFLDQNVPMQMGGRRVDEKSRKGRRRRKSDEFSADQLINCNMLQVQAKPKRKYRKRSAQNPPSVESMDGPLSVDNSVFTPLSESGSHQAEDMGYRSASQTPNSVHNSWGMDTKMSCSDSISIAMSIADGNQMEHVSQDLLDSVFSPDTTMSSTTNHEMPDPGNCVPQGSSPVMQSHSPLSAQHHNNNQPMNASHKHNMFPPQSNNNVSSTGEATCPFISTSTHSATPSAKLEEAEEAHPLEILQAQIKIQRKQFNLGESQQSQSVETKNGVKTENSYQRADTALPSDLEMDLLSGEDSTWYLSEEQQKDGGGLWDDLCPKGQTNTSSKPLLLAMQS